MSEFPIICIDEEILPRVWELSVKETFEKGILIDSEWGEKCKEVTL